MTDCIGCRHVYNCFRNCWKRCLKCILKQKQKVKLEKPDSMKDVLDSNSDSDDDKNDSFKGLSNASIHLGEGAVLYLQTMKTFAFLL